MPNSGHDRIRRIKQQLAEGELERVLSAFADLNQTLGPITQSEKFKNALRLRDSFIRSISTCSSIAELEQKFKIFSDKVNPSLSRFTEEIQEKAKPHADFLETKLASCLLDFSFTDETQNEKTAQEELREILNITQQDCELLALAQTTVRQISTFNCIEGQISSATGLVRRILEFTEKCKNLLDARPPLSDEDQTRVYLQQFSQQLKELDDESSSIQWSLNYILGRNLPTELGSLLIERVRTHEAEFAAQKPKLAAGLESAKRAHQNAQYRAEQEIRSLFNFLKNQGLPDYHLESFRHGLARATDPMRRRTILLHLASIGCKPRDLVPQDFADRPAPETEYQAKAKLFMLFLAHCPQYQAMMCEGQDPQSWFSSAGNLNKFMAFMRIAYEKVSAISPATIDYTTPEASLLTEAGSFIQDQGLAITPLQLFSPTIAYARTKVADAICGYMADKLDFQRYFLGHQGEKALSKEEIRELIIQTERELKANSPLAAFGKAMGFE